MANATAGCPPGMRRDDSFFHAAPGDCSMPEGLLLGVLVAVSAMALVFLAVISRLLVGQIHCAGRGPAGVNIKPNARLVLVATLGQLCIVTQAASVYAQGGFFEAAAGNSIIFGTSLILLSWILLGRSLKPFSIALPDGRESTRRGFYYLDVWCICNLVILTIGWSLLAANSRVDFTAYNFGLACFIILYLDIAGAVIFVSLFSNLLKMERILLSAADRTPHMRPALAEFVARSKAFRMHMGIFIYMNLVSSLPVCLYLLIEGSFPVNVPMSSVFYVLTLWGYEVFFSAPVISLISFRPRKPVQENLSTGNTPEFVDVRISNYNPPSRSSIMSRELGLSMGRLRFARMREYPLESAVSSTQSQLTSSAAGPGQRDIVP